MDAGTSYVQTGWNVRTSDGHEVGTVVDLSHDSLFVRDNGGRRRTVPKSYVDEEDESQRLAILSIDSEDLELGAFLS